MSLDQMRTAQRRLVIEGVFSRAMDACTGGVVLAGFALALGASDLEIGVLAAIPFAAQLAHIPAVSLLTRAADPKRVTVVASSLSRTVLVLFAALPLVALPLRPSAALIALFAAYALVANVGGAAWQVWARGVVGRAELGTYFARRMLVLSAVGLVGTLAAGQVVELWPRWYPGSPLGAYAVLYVVGALLGAASSLVLARTPGVRPPPADPRGLRDALSRPLRDPNYRRILTFLAAWGFAANLALPFVTVVLLRTLGLGLGTVVVLAAVSQLANIAALRMWGPVTDRFGNKPVLGLSASVFVLAMLAWAVLPDTPTRGVLIGAGVFHFLLGLATAGLDLASNGLVMKVAPDDDTAAFLSSASLVKAVAAGAAPLVGGVLAALLHGRALVVDATWQWPGGAGTLLTVQLAHHDFLFVASALVGLYAVHRLLGFEEAGEAPPEVVARALRREVGQFSSVAGMRQFAHLASYVVEAAYRFEKRLEPRR